MTVNDFWGREPNFFKGVVSGKSTVFQDMASRSDIYRQFKLDKTDYLKINKQVSKQTTTATKPGHKVEGGSGERSGGK